MPTTTDRTWRLQVFTDQGIDPRVEYLRERVKTYDDGEVVRTPIGSVVRQLSQVAAEPIPGGPVTVTTMADLYQLVGAMGHHFAAEDAARAAAQAAAEG